MCAVASDGAGYCWGSDELGQLGNGPALTGDQASPSPVATPAGVTWASISVGLGDHACGVTTTGAAYCWGSDFSGKLGNGSLVTAAQDAPSPVDTPAGVLWQTVSAGLHHTCGLTTAGAIYCWGNVTGTVMQSPVVVPGGPWATVAAGGNVVCAVTTAGAGYCWGSDSDGQLGNGPDAHRHPGRALGRRDAGRGDVGEHRHPDHAHLWEDHRRWRLLLGARTSRAAGGTGPRSPGTKTPRTRWTHRPAWCGRASSPSGTARPVACRRSATPTAGAPTPSASRGTGLRPGHSTLPARSRLRPG